jgi:pyruvate-formate lyase-activating enzyme
MKKTIPNLVLSDARGRIYIHPVLKMMASSANSLRLPQEYEMIPLPKGCALFYMPAHLPVGYDAEDNCEAIISEFKGRRVFAVSAFLIPGFTRLLLPAAKKLDKDTILPLWSYAAVGWLKGRYQVAAIKIDAMSRHKPFYYRDRKLLRSRIEESIKLYPQNRLIKHLAHCAFNYNCRTAQNLFFRRWEAPLPVSPVCNARCLGCLSLQDSDCVTASHERINFVPTPDELKEVAVSHLNEAKEAIVSFGQGCEGEPLLQFETLKQAIIKIRKTTDKGTIHLNTNAYSPDYLEELAELGLSSVRISLNSFQDDFYSAYYKPRGYKLKDVLRSIKTAKKSGLFVSLNLLVFPGLTDTPRELNRLLGFLKSGYIDLLQLRNLCIDPEFYLNKVPVIKEKPLGIYNMIRLIKRSSPRTRLGYFNPARERFNLS